MASQVNAVYLDTNILRRHPFYQLGRALSEWMDATMPGAGPRDIDVWVPELAVRELAAQFAKLLDERDVAYRRAEAELVKHAPQLPRSGYVPPWRSDRDFSTRAIKEQLQTAGVGIVSTPPIDVSVLLEMSLAQTPPFDAGGHGFGVSRIFRTDC